MTVVDTPADHRRCADHGCAALRPTRRSRVVPTISAPLAVIALLVAGVLLIDAGGTAEGQSWCVFRRCTGGYCPGCGVSRAARNLLHGDVGAAWADHPWLVLAAAQAVLGGLTFVLVPPFRRWWAGTLATRIVVAVGGANLVVLLGIWIARLADGSIPRFF